MWFIAPTSSPPFSFRLLCVGLASGLGRRAALDRFTFTGFSFFNISFPQLITRAVLCRLEGPSGVSRRPISASLPPQVFKLIHCYISPASEQVFRLNCFITKSRSFPYSGGPCIRQFFGGDSSTLEICNQTEKSSLNVMFNILACRRIITVRLMQDNNLAGGKPHSIHSYLGLPWIWHRQKPSYQPAQTFE